MQCRCPAQQQCRCQQPLANIPEEPDSNNMMVFYSGAQQAAGQVQKEEFLRNEQTLEKFENLGISDEHLARKNQQENKMRQPYLSKQKRMVSTLTGQRRKDLLNFASYVLCLAGAPASSWFGLSSLLDLCMRQRVDAVHGRKQETLKVKESSSVNAQASKFSRCLLYKAVLDKAPCEFAVSTAEMETALKNTDKLALNGKNLEEIKMATTCATLALVLLKMDNASRAPAPSSMAKLASSYAFSKQVVGQDGKMAAADMAAEIATPPQLVTEEMLLKEEVRVLKLLGWNVNVPTPEFWISAFTSRFDALTFNYFAASVSWVQHRSKSLASGIVLSGAVLEELGQKTLAEGLICISFVVAGLLPLSTLQPDAFTEQEWKDMFRNSQPDAGVVADGSSARQGMDKSMKQLLQAACNTDWASLQDSSAQVMQTMSKASQAPGRRG